MRKRRRCSERDWKNYRGIGRWLLCSLLWDFGDMRIMNSNPRACFPPTHRKNSDVRTVFNSARPADSANAENFPFLVRFHLSSQKNLKTAWRQDPEGLHCWFISHSTILVSQRERRVGESAKHLYVISLL